MKMTGKKCKLQASVGLCTCGPVTWATFRIWPSGGFYVLRVVEEGNAPTFLSAIFYLYDNVGFFMSFFFPELSYCISALISRTSITGR